MNQQVYNGLANAHQFRSCDLCGSRFLFPGADAMVDMAGEAGRPRNTNVYIMHGVPGIAREVR